MVLRPEQFTQKALAVIQKSQEVLAEYMHTQWDTEHLLLALLDEKDGVAFDLFDGLGVSMDSLLVCMVYRPLLLVMVATSVSEEIVTPNSEARLAYPLVASMGSQYPDIES